MDGRISARHGTRVKEAPTDEALAEANLLQALTFFCACATAPDGAIASLGAPEQLPLDDGIICWRWQDLLDDRQRAPSRSEFDDRFAKLRIEAQVSLEVIVRFRVGARDVIEKQLIEFVVIAAIVHESPFRSASAPAPAPASSQAKAASLVAILHLRITRNAAGLDGARPWLGILNQSRSAGGLLNGTHETAGRAVHSIRLEIGRFDQ